MVDISDFSKVNNLVDNHTRMMSNVMKAQNKISTGNKLISMQDLADLGDSELLMGLEKDSIKTENYIQLGNDALRMMRYQDDQLNQLITVASDLYYKLTTLQSSSGTAMGFPNLGKNSLEQIKSILNSNFENKYIFSGNNTNEVPVGNIVNSSNILQGQVTSNYYQGGNNTERVVIADDYSISYGITADNKAFQYLIAAIHEGIGASSLASGNIDSDKVSNALDYIKTAAEELVDLRAKLGNNMNAIENKMNEHDDFKNYLRNVISEIKTADIALETTVLQEQLYMLNASYIVNRSLKDGLVNYI
jgi:flagellar hook-associated protein 3 FlgL